MKQEYNIPNNLDGNGLRFALVGSEWHKDAVGRMIAACRDVFKKANLPDENISVYRVPGSFEIPVMCKHICSFEKPDAILVFGAILRGQTHHFDQMVGSIPAGLMQISVTTGIPILSGIIAADTEELIAARTQGKANKGYEVALAALELAKTVKNISQKFAA